MGNNFFEDEDLFEDEGGPEDVVENFLEAWSEQNFEAAYDYLSAESPLRGGLSQQEWVAQRTAWVQQAHPSEAKYSAFFDYGTADEEATKEADSTSYEVEAFWSVEMSETPGAATLKELPQATMTYAETNRRWFWSTFRLVEQDDELLIQDMIDEGALAQQLSTEELLNDIEQITQEIQNLALSLGAGDLESEEPQLPEDTLIMESDPAEVMEQLGMIGQRALHYSDAVIAQTPTDSTQYERAAALAALLQEWERAAAYIELLSDRFPEQRGEALSSLAIVISNLVAYYEREGAVDRAVQFSQLVEKKLRDAIAADNSFTAHILLADLLVDQAEKLEEAQSLLAEANQMATTPQERAQVENGLGHLADAQEDFTTALRHYQRAAELDAELPDIWINVGDAYSKLNMLVDAEKSYLRALAANPEEAYPYVELASIYTTQSNFSAAHAILDQGMEHSTAADLYASRAIVYIYADDLRSAEEYLLEAEEIDPDLELVQGARQLFDTRKAQMRSNKQKSNKPNRPNNPKKRR